MSANHRVLVVNPDLCTGCRLCEMICSLWHEDKCGTSFSRVQVAQWGEIGVAIPVVCQSCKDPPCEKACPTTARQRVESTGAVITDPEVCVGCKSCVYACPFGAPAVHPESKKLMTCDLCSGEPQCVKVCNTGALRYTDKTDIALKRKRYFAGHIARYWKRIEE